MKGHEFQTEKEFREWVEKNGFRKGYTQYALDIIHERSHFNKAVSLGYNPHYNIKKIHGEWVPAVEIKGKVKITDNIGILLAPKNPSLSDMVNIILEEAKL
tara:strand:- start:145 stop:447 length:303 start_codon:yes stop_codon:yes gene_type:complete